MKAIRFRPIAVVLLSLHLGGCYTWQPVALSPAQFVQQEAPSEVRVYWVAGGTTELLNPWIEGDSLVGRTPEMGAHEMVRIAQSALIGVEARRFSPGLTLGAISLIPVAVVTVLLGIYSFSADGTGPVFR